MLKGININLRALEPEDISLISDWLNNIDFQGRYTPLIQRSKEEMKKRFGEISDDQKMFKVINSKITKLVKCNPCQVQKSTDANSK